ncbi:hypothetical protein F5Y17DRAFT_434280 [Xylariaceae sp. FL0594]|nr:hypothetical protein F5Y17DRAFT_434280 [Xylariaceae sp. FL0594]
MTFPLLCTTLLILLRPAASDPATITNAAVYSSQRPCAQDCFVYGFYTGPDKLASAIGCEYRNPQNECFCRGDLQPKADAYLRNCVDRGCNQNTLDTDSALSIYDAYCTGAGYLRTTPATTATTAAGPSSTLLVSQSSTSPPQSSTSPNPIEPSSNAGKGSNVPVDSSQTQSSAPTDTASAGSGHGSGSGSGNSNALGTSDIIGIVVGILGLIVAVIGVYFSWKAIQKKRQQNPWSL